MNVSDLNPADFSGAKVATTTCDGVSNAFVGDVIPIFDKRGCAVSGCHGGTSPAGSLNLDKTQGNDTLFSQVTGQGRTNTTSPKSSRILRKPLGLDNHGGSKIFKGVTDPDYTTLFCWISAGAGNTTSTTPVATPTPTPVPTP